MEKYHPFILIMSDIYNVLDFALELLNTRLTFSPFSFTILDFLGFLALTDLALHPTHRRCDEEDEFSDKHAGHGSEAGVKHQFLKFSHGRTSVKPGNRHPHRLRNRTQHLPYHPEAHQHG